VRKKNIVHIYLHTLCSIFAGVMAYTKLKKIISLKMDTKIISRLLNTLFQIPNYWKYTSTYRRV